MVWTTTTTATTTTTTTVVVVVVVACQSPCGFSGMDAESRPKTLVKQLDCSYDDQRTSSSMINAVVGGIDPAGKHRFVISRILQYASCVFDVPFIHFTVSFIRF